MGNMNSLKEFYGPNAGYVLELYDRFLHDPASVDVQTRRLFESFPPKREERPEVESERIEPGQPSATVVSDNWKIAVVRLAQSIRQFGHLAARLDPLGLLSSEGASQQNVMKRDLVTQYGLDDETLRRLPSDLIGDSIASMTKNAFEAIEALQKFIPLPSVSISNMFTRQKRERGCVIQSKGNSSRRLRCRLMNMHCWRN